MSPLSQKDLIDPNGENYGLNPLADPGHRHSSASVANTSPVFSSPTFVSTTAQQCSTTSNATLYITINTAASLAVSMGPTSATADALIVAESVALSNITLIVPLGWWVKLTGTMADLTISQVTG